MALILSDKKSFSEKDVKQSIYLCFLDSIREFSKSQKIGCFYGFMRDYITSVKVGEKINCEDENLPPSISPNDANHFWTDLPYKQSSDQNFSHYQI